MQDENKPRRNLREVIVSLNFYPRSWAPDDIPESIKVKIRCLLSKAPREEALVVDGAYPLVRLPGGIARPGIEPVGPKKVFRTALLEALQKKVAPDSVRTIALSVVDWEGGMLDE